jgi:hypothetical protein
MTIAHPARCRRAAERMDTLLRQQLGRGIDPDRMLFDTLYARDVLLVCQALRETEGPALAEQFRAALTQADGPATETPPAAAPAAAPGRAAPRQVPLRRTAEVPARAADPEVDDFLARGHASRWHGEDSVPAESLPPTGPQHFDNPETWPPGASEPNLSDAPWTVSPGTTGPGGLPGGARGTPPSRRDPRNGAARRWFSPSRWFGRG